MCNRNSTLRTTALAAITLTLLLASGSKAPTAFAQQQTYSPPSLQQPTPIDPRTGKIPDTEPTDPFKGAMEAKQARAARDDRHKRLIDDSAKLVALSNELQVEVNKAGKDDLSLTVIRKADQIEKLAHDVKERMKN